MNVEVHVDIVKKDKRRRRKETRKKKTKMERTRNPIPVSPPFVRLRETFKIISRYWLILIILKVAIQTF